VVWFSLDKSVHLGNYWFDKGNSRRGSDFSRGVYWDCQGTLIQVNKNSVGLCTTWISISNINQKPYQKKSSKDISKIILSLTISSRLSSLIFANSAFFSTKTRLGMETSILTIFIWQRIIPSGSTIIVFC